MLRRHLPCLLRAAALGSAAPRHAAFREGKLPRGLLRRTVLSHLGASQPSVVVGPAWGEDSAILRVPGLISATTDPITGASASLGQLVVHVNANDVAASGADPKWMLVTALYPVGTSPDLVESVSLQVDATCKKLGVAIVGGHTELTSAVTRPVLVGTMLGPLLSKEPILTAGARVGDRLILTKGAALEGTAILCEDRKAMLVQGGVFRSETDAEQVARQHAAQLSVVQDARVALSALPEGAVSSMHDPTEGGVAGALHEVADCSGKGFTLLADRVPVSAAARHVCSFFGVDPLYLISSGALLMCVASEQSARLLDAFARAGIVAADIGCVEADPSVRNVVRGGRCEALLQAEQDALWSALDKH